MDHIGYSLNFVASGIAHWLHDGWGHSYPTGHRHHRISGPTYSGTKNIVVAPLEWIEPHAAWQREGVQSASSHRTEVLGNKTWMRKRHRFAFIAIVRITPSIEACRDPLQPPPHIQSKQGGAERLPLLLLT